MALFANDGSVAEFASGQFSQSFQREVDSGRISGGAAGSQNRLAALESLLNTARTTGDAAALEAVANDLANFNPSSSADSSERDNQRQRARSLASQARSQASTIRSTQQQQQQPSPATVPRPVPRPTPPPRPGEPPSPFISPEQPSIEQRIIEERERQQEAERQRQETLRVEAERRQRLESIKDVEQARVFLSRFPGFDDKDLRKIESDLRNERITGQQALSRLQKAQDKASSQIGARQAQDLVNNLEQGGLAFSTKDKKAVDSLLKDARGGKILTSADFNKINSAIGRASKAFSGELLTDVRGQATDARAQAASAQSALAEIEAGFEDIRRQGAAQAAEQRGLLDQAREEFSQQLTSRRDRIEVPSPSFGEGDTIPGGGEPFTTLDRPTIDPRDQVLGLFGASIFNPQGGLNRNEFALTFDPLTGQITRPPSTVGAFVDERVPSIVDPTRQGGGPLQRTDVSLGAGGREPFSGFPGLSIPGLSGDPLEPLLGPAVGPKPSTGATQGPPTPPSFNIGGPAPETPGSDLTQTGNLSGQVGELPAGLGIEGLLSAGDVVGGGPRVERTGSTAGTPSVLDAEGFFPEDAGLGGIDRFKGTIPGANTLGALFSDEDQVGPGDIIRDIGGLLSPPGFITGAELIGRGLSSLAGFLGGTPPGPGENVQLPQTTPAFQTDVSRAAATGGVGGELARAGASLSSLTGPPAAGQEFARLGNVNAGGFSDAGGDVGFVSDLFGGGDRTSTSTTTVVQQPPQRSPEELELIRAQIDALNRQNQAFDRQFDQQGQLFDQLQPLIGQQSAFLDSIIEQQRQQQALAAPLFDEQLNLLRQQGQRQQFELEASRQAFQQQTAFFEEQLAQARNFEPLIAAELEAAAESRRQAGEINEIIRQQLEQGTRATPEQLELIDEQISASQAQGESDISEFQQETLRQLADELAPSLGLRPEDTPILDRGGEIAEAATRQQGQLTRNLQEARANAALNFPLAEQQVLGAQALSLQGLNQTAAEFGAQLREAAFANRIRLADSANALFQGVRGGGAIVNAGQNDALNALFNRSNVALGGQQNLLNTLLQGSFSPLPGVGGGIGNVLNAIATPGPTTQTTIGPSNQPSSLSNILGLGLGLAGIFS